jgi:hypothetical protein
MLNVGVEQGERMEKFNQLKEEKVGKRGGHMSPPASALHLVKGEVNLYFCFFLFKCKYI